ncbi:MAG: DUF1848 domain-containing protein [Lachnospiraceae bacterium]
MILSVSRRTDIPNYYSDWFYERIREGFLYVRNPMNPHQVSRISLSPELVDCIVFWTKNPEPMMARLSELADYNYYFQFTLTGYGTDLERNVPHKKEVMIPVFKRLSGQIGVKRVIWRYDPILFTERYSAAYHVKAFGQIAAALSGYTKKCVISFVDTYAKNRKSMERIGVRELPEEEQKEFARKLAEIAHQNGMSIATCAEKLDLSDCGIEHNACIDPALIEEIVGCKLRAKKDANQRSECGCVESVEVGTYHTCKNGCLYCYANQSEARAEQGASLYDIHSPILCGHLSEQDVITERKITSLKLNN